MNSGLLLYRSALKIFSVAANAAALFNPKAKLFVAGRKNLWPEIERSLASSKGKRIWFHCASLGEFEQGRPVIEKFKSLFPTFEILITFYSPSGYEIRKNYAQADYVFYLPIDSRANAKKFVDLVNPELAVFIKYEFWHFYLSELKKRKIPVISVSSIFRSEQVFFKGYGGFYRQILSFFDHFFVQDSNSKQLLEEIGIKDVTVSGDTRFDRVHALAQNNKTVPHIEQFKNQKPVMVIGSCWKEDLDVLIPFINSQRKGLKFIIAPHEIDEHTIKTIQVSIEAPTIRYSKIKEQELSACQVLIIDNIGLLSSLYKYGEYAYVGGAFGKGLHNILEPATYGIPVIFGDRNYVKFKEAKDLIALGGAFAIGDTGELLDVFEALGKLGTLAEAGRINAAYIRNNIGATDQILNYCSNLLDNPNR